MFEFRPENPFPLFAHDAYTLGQAQRHAAQVDAWLGLETEQIESELRAQSRLIGRMQDVEDWIGLPVQALLTPYLEIRSMLHELAPGDGSILVDLGAGYGRMAWILGEHYPSARFIGYELRPERVRESLRCLASRSYPNVQMIEADLAAPGFLMPEADFYFMYDFGSRFAIDQVLGKLQAVASHRPITVIGRGRSSRDAIERSHPWLSQIVAPFHTRSFSIYRSG
jgi:hypothetical protein